MTSNIFTTPDSTLASFFWDQKSGVITAVPHSNCDTWCAWFNSREVICKTLYEANELAIRYGTSF